MFISAKNWQDNFISQRKPKIDPRNSHPPPIFIHLALPLWLSSCKSQDIRWSSLSRDWWKYSEGRILYSLANWCSFPSTYEDANMLGRRWNERRTHWAPVYVKEEEITFHEIGNNFPVRLMDSVLYESGTQQAGGAPASVEYGTMPRMWSRTYELGTTICGDMGGPLVERSNSSRLSVAGQLWRHNQ